MKYYYLINNKLMWHSIEIPKLIEFNINYTNWYSSLKPCYIEENELTNVVRHLSIYDNENYNTGLPINVTDIIEERESISNLESFIVFKNKKDVIDRTGYVEGVLGYKTSIHTTSIIEINDKNKQFEMKDNKIELLKEDLECVHLYLDDLKIPRKDSNNDDYSIVGRIKFLESKNTNTESQEKLYDDFAKTIVSGGLNLCRKHFTLTRK